MASKAKTAAPEMLRLEYVPVETVTAWERNPKRHDVGAIWESIQRHGFKDPPKFEPKLNGGRGAIVEGNGRSHVIKEMQAAGETVPRGILVNPEGLWLMPVLFGVDAESEKAAEAYGVDHNNLVLSGGDFSNTDIARLWNETEYADLLAGLANSEALPVSVDGEDVDDLIGRLASEGNNSSIFDSYDQPPGSSKPVGKVEESYFGVVVICEGEGEQAEYFSRLREEGYEVRMQGTKPPGVKR